MYELIRNSLAFSRLVYRLELKQHARVMQGVRREQDEEQDKNRETHVDGRNRHKKEMEEVINQDTRREWKMASRNGNRKWKQSLQVCARPDDWQEERNNQEKS